MRSVLLIPPPPNRGTQSVNKLLQVIQPRKREKKKRERYLNPNSLSPGSKLNCLPKSLEGLNEIMDIKNLAWCVQGSKHLMDFSLGLVEILLVASDTDPIQIKLICTHKYSERTLLTYMTDKFMGQMRSAGLDLSLHPLLCFSSCWLYS